MGKNFMGYNNASELLTAIGNKIKAKYTKPTAGIPKSDLVTDVQTSLGLADSAVQPSSLVEVVDNGAKNAANINDFTFTASSASGGVRDIEIPCSPLTGYISIKIGSIASTDTDANTCAFILYYTNDSSSPTQQFSRGSNIEVTLNLESAILSYIAIYPSNNYINSGGDTLTVSNLMITTKSQSDISPEYESYALGNQILTPALIEQVDGGAKNILPPTNLIPTGGGLTNNPNLTCTNNGDGTYTLNGSTVANGMIIIHRSITSDVYGGHMLSGTPKVNTSLSEKCRLSIYTDVGASGVCHETGNGRLIPESFNSSYLAIYVFSGNTFNNLTFYPMICTLADWKVSQKFVPYRPNWDLVSMSVWNYVESAFTSTAADTYQYSGLSVTVPANQLYEIIVSDRAGNTITTGILISDDNTNVEYQVSVVAENSSAYSVADSAIWSRQVHCITPKTYNTARTYYVWVKRKAMGSNTLILAYRRIV